MRAVKATFPDVKIIALTDSLDHEFLEAGGRGNLTFLEKPVGARALLGSVRDVLAIPPRGVSR